MYYFFMGLQILCLMLVMASALRILLIKNARASKHLLFTAICIAVYATGYLEEMLCTTKEAAMAAYGFEYMGLSFAALAHFLFVLDFCEIDHFPTAIKHSIFVLDCFTEVSVLLMDKVPFFYSSVSFDTDGLYPHLVTEKGPLFWIFVAVEFTLMISAALLLWRQSGKVYDKNIKTSCLTLMVGTIFPLIGFVINLTGILGAFECASAVFCLMALYVTVVLSTGRLTDVKAIAYASLYENTSEGIIIIGADGKYIDSNANAKSIFPELNLCIPGSGIENLRLPEQNGENENYVERDGKCYVCNQSDLIVKDKNIGTVITVNDVSEMRERVEEMKLLRDAANEANKAKSVFLTNMSHELRTPLNAIIGMAELSLKENNKKTIMDYVDQIKSSGNMLLDIVSEILDISKAESGKLELVSAEYDLKELLNAVINVINMRIGDKPIEFIVDIDPKIPKKVLGDAVRVRQILLNFLGNADKFTQAGSIVFTMAGEEHDGKVRLKCSVADTGRGIRAEDQDKLFKPFSQVDNLFNRSVSGSGLGLSIAAGLIEKMDGSYRVESEYGAGSTFYFEFEQELQGTETLSAAGVRQRITVPKLTTFVLYDDGEQAKDQKTSEEDKKNKTYPEASVLVVDDNRVNVKVLCSFLKHFGILADCAYNGPDAIRMAGKKDYQVIFMDHMMPDMDGVETTKRIRSAGYPTSTTVKIIACTANVVKGMEEMFLENGMDDFVPKPVQMDVLADKLDKYLS